MTRSARSLTWHEAGLGGDEEAAAVDAVLQQVHQGLVHRVLPTAMPVMLYAHHIILAACADVAHVAKCACSCHLEGVTEVSRHSSCCMPHVPVVAGGVDDIATVCNRLDDGARYLLVSLLVFIAKVRPCVCACPCSLVPCETMSASKSAANAGAVGSDGAVQPAHMITYPERAQGDPADSKGQRCH